MKKATNFLKPWKKIGLVTTLQHSHKIVEMKEILLKEDKKVVIGNTGKLLRAGQVTGCDYSNAKAIAEKVEVFLFVGGGKFHALGVALSTRKPTIIADPYQKKVTPVEDVTKVMKKRWANIHETKQAKTIGVLVGLKIGQKRFDQALRIKKLLEDAGKKSVVLALKEITPEALMQFPTIDAFVNTACPRLSLDDNSRFQKPLLTPSEMCAVLGKLSWDELCRKGWFEN